MEGADRTSRPTSVAVFSLLSNTLEEYLRKAEPGGQGDVNMPERQLNNLRVILDTQNISYRDAALIQLAYAISSPARLDLTLRQKGGRTVAQKLGKFLADNHIQHVADAFQNIGKNTPQLARGNFQEFDEFLGWISGNEASRDELRAAFAFACRSVAATARPVLPMPQLALAKLDFWRVSEVIRRLFSRSSGGAFEQFVVAALLHSVVAQAGLTDYRVETKSLHASDKSSRTAGDVQIMNRTYVVEAYEVTANEWTEKLSGARETIRANDLSRLHIVAKVTGEPDSLIELRELDEDVSVLEINSFAAALVASLTRRFRDIALRRLYELLDRFQPDVARVNDYVRLLRELDLTET
jgi:hypothetical protein